MTSNSLALIQQNEYQLITSLAKIAADSGYCGKNPQQAAFIMIKGYELGISPMQALDGIQVIQGKTTVSPQLMLALINRSGELEDQKIDATATAATVMMKRRGRTAHTETFTIDDAKRMGLASKDNWNKQPATMLKWRAVAACARIVFPDVIQGMYTPEEMGAVVIEDSAGDVTIIEGESTPVIETLPAPIAVDTATGEIVDQPATPKYTQAQPAELDWNKVIAKAGDLFKSSSQERFNTVNAMKSENAFAGVTTIEAAAELVAARVKSHRQPKTQESQPEGEFQDIPF